MTEIFNFFSFGKKEEEKRNIENYYFYYYFIAKLYFIQIISLQIKVYNMLAFQAFAVRMSTGLTSNTTYNSSIINSNYNSSSLAQRLCQEYGNFSTPGSALLLSKEVGHS